jgi:hypothetical protein
VTVDAAKAETVRDFFAMVDNLSPNPRRRAPLCEAEKAGKQ